jgi:hypothetical protein
MLSRAWSRKMAMMLTGKINAKNNYNESSEGQATRKAQ